MVGGCYQVESGLAGLIAGLAGLDIGIGVRVASVGLPGLPLDLVPA
jgi:hypothetical protein